MAQKNAASSQQAKSKREAEEVLDAGIAAKIRYENTQITQEIARMRSELRKTRQASQFQQAATDQVKLRAEKAALEEQIASADEIKQVAIAALVELQDGSAAVSGSAADQAEVSGEIARAQQRLSDIEGGHSI